MVVTCDCRWVDGEPGGWSLEVQSVGFSREMPWRDAVGREPSLLVCAFTNNHVDLVGASGRRKGNNIVQTVPERLIGANTKGVIEPRAIRI